MNNELGSKTKILKLSIFTAAVLGLGIDLDQAAASVITDCSNVKALYHFDGNMIDSSNSLANGVCNGSNCPTATLDRFSNANKALNFDGDDYVEITNPNLQTELTFSAWVLPKSESVNGMTLASAWAWNSGGTGWFLGEGGGGNNYRLLFKLFGTNGSEVFIPKTDFFKDYYNQWVQIAGVFKAGQFAKLYVNGSLANSQTANVISSINYKNGVKMRIGSNPETTEGRWIGGVDEVILWDKALSDQEIGEVYNSANSVTCAPVACGDGTCNGNETCGLTNTAPECNQDCQACSETVVKKWDVQEINLVSSSTYSNPYTEVEVVATFNGPGGIVKTVKGFWDGGNNYKIRFTPTVTGNWTYSVTNNKGDAGLAKQSQQLTVTGANVGNKGFVRVDNQYNQAMVFDNGEHYFMLGTTAYEYITNAKEDINRWKSTVNHYAAHGINKVRMYVFPTNYDYYCQEQSGGMKYGDNTRPFLDATSGTGYTEPDFDKLNLSHWQLLDEMVEYMEQQKMVADIIMLNDPCYGRAYDTVFNNNNLPTQKDQRFMNYIISRYAAYPNVIWCITNEFQLSGTDAKPQYGTGKPQGSTWNNYWNFMGNLVSENDPWTEDSGKKRLLSIHGTAKVSDVDTTKRFLQKIPYLWFDFGEQSWPTYVVGEWGVYQSYISNPPECDTWSCRNYSIEYLSDWEAQRTVMKPLKNQELPVTNDEWVYIGDHTYEDPVYGGKFFDSKENRIFMWGLAAAGSYLSIGDAYSEQGGTSWGYKYFSTGNYSDTGEMQKTFDQMKHLRDFFSKIEYWKMSSHNELVPQYSSVWGDDNRVYTLADPGNEYVIYDATGATFTINLVADKYYKVYIFNPREGIETFIKDISGGAQVVTPPAGGEDWVYWIKVAPPEPSRGLVGHWKLDDSAGAASIIDSSGKGNNGVNNGATLGVAGKINTAAQFNGLAGGNNNIAITDPGADSVFDFTAGDPITISAWIKPGLLVPRTDVDALFSIIAKNDYAYGINAEAFNGGTTSKLVFTSRSDQVKWCEYYVSSSLQKDTLYHIAVTHTYGKGVDTKVYVDGIKQSGTWWGEGGACTGNHSPAVSNKPVWIGSSELVGQFLEEWIGMIDDVRIYDRVLTQAEITELANPSDFDPADVNEDGNVNIKDIQACIKVITGSDKTYEDQCRVLAPPIETTNIKDIQVIIRDIIK